MLPEKGTGEVLSENPMRAKGDPSTNKGRDIEKPRAYCSVRQLCFLESGNISMWVRLQTGLPFHSLRAVLERDTSF